MEKPEMDTGKCPVGLEYKRGPTVPRRHILTTTMTTTIATVPVARRYTTTQVKARAFKHVLERNMWAHLNRINAIVYKHLPSMPSPKRIELLRELNRATALTVFDTMCFTTLNFQKITAAELAVLGGSAANPTNVEDDNAPVQVSWEEVDGKLMITNLMAEDAAKPAEKPAEKPAMATTKPAAKRQSVKKLTTVKFKN